MFVTAVYNFLTVVYNVLTAVHNILTAVYTSVTPGTLRWFEFNSVIGISLRSSMEFWAEDI